MMGEFLKMLIYFDSELVPEIYIIIYIYLVGGLEHEFYFSIYWEFHHPN